MVTHVKRILKEEEGRRLESSDVEERAYPQALGLEGHKVGDHNHIIRLYLGGN